MDALMAAISFLALSGLCGFTNGERPEVVNIGAVLSYDSVIGKVAKAAIEAAVEDINANATVLGGTRLNLVMRNSDCNAFLASVGVLQVLEKEAVAIIGPQSSAVAHMISYISNGLQIPLISFAATDPTLSALQFPFFLRITQSDSYQMAAMANLIFYYGWRQVIAIYLDDDYGRNGIYSLDDELAKKMSKISYKIVLPVGATQEYISDLLQKSKIIGPRVYVVHVTPDSGLPIFSTAQQLQMMTDEYVWLATDWLCATLDAYTSVNYTSSSYLQGVVGFRQYIPQSKQKVAFVSRWSDLHGGGVVSSELNTYGFYAYDAVWAVAHAINDFVNESGNITFSSASELRNIKGRMQLEKLKTFDGGQILLDKLLGLNFTGIAGPIQFDKDHNLNSGIYEVINIDGSMIHTVGYWANHLGLSTSLPGALHGNNQRNISLNQGLGNITWPGGSTNTPRGWVAGTSEKPLRIGIPYRTSYREFVNITKDGQVKGYCVDVFNAALKLVPYDVPHQFVPFGDGLTSPNYDDLVNMVLDNVFDAAIGDITIATNRTKIVDFTQPYISTGLVILAPLKNPKSSAWVFLRPFTVEMWCVTAAFFFLIGVVIWLLEHRVNSDFRGSPKRQCATMFLFSFSTPFHTEQEEPMTTLGRFVMMVWLFLIMVVTSSYTASLTSFLTVQQLPSPINGIDSLIASNDPIGYQLGSFSRSYLIDGLNIRQSRLVSLSSPEDYKSALQLGPKNGGVTAIIDELPYVELFLSNTSGFGIVGQSFTRGGWGFAFPRDSSVAVDISTAILNLSENGDLQKIHNDWFCQSGCIDDGGKGSDPNQLHVSSFWGLFLICGVTSIASLLLFLLRAVRQYIRFSRKDRDPASASEAPSTGCSHSLCHFFDFIDEKEEAIKNKFKEQPQQGSSRPQAAA